MTKVSSGGQDDTSGHGVVASSEDRLRALAEASPMVIYEGDTQARLSYINDRWTSMTGQQVADALGHGWMRVIEEADRALVARAAQEATSGRHGFDLRFRVSHPTRGRRWLHASSAPLHGPAGQVRAFVGSVRDITDQVEAEQANERLRDLLDTSTDFVCVADLDGRVRYANPSATRTLGLVPGKRTMFDTLDPASRAIMHRVVAENLARGGTWQGELTMVTNDSALLPVSLVAIVHVQEGTPARLSIIARDVSEFKGTESRLRYLATHDRLTGLGNRDLIAERIAAAAQAGGVAVAFVDLDGFKEVNDTHGHDAGDALLAAVARRLEGLLRSGDTAARFGGDEFVLACGGVSSPAEATAIAERVRAGIRQPFMIGSEPVAIDASVGMALGSDPPATTPARFIEWADAAMYRAKRAGRVVVVVDGVPVQAGTSTGETRSRR